MINIGWFMALEFWTGVILGMIAMYLINKIRNKNVKGKD